MYPQKNGQAKSTNKTIVNTLRKRLEKAKGKWVDKLPGVLWLYITTTQTYWGYPIIFGVWNRSSHPS